MRSEELSPLPDPKNWGRRYEGCYGCGQANPRGLRLRFEIAGERVQTTFTSDETHQGYPGLLHGGVLYSVLDETMGQTATFLQTWVMTGRLEVRYLAPTPIGRSLQVSAWVTRRRRQAFEIAGEAQLIDGPLVARASGLFMRVPDSLLRDVSAGVDPTQVERFDK